MPQDAFTLRPLCAELDDIFKNGKVNRITQPSENEAYFTVYTGKGTRKLYISVNPQSPAISVSEDEKESPLTAPNFCMLLRKHLLSATVKSVSLLGFDRIVKIEFISGGDFSYGEEKTLYVELMGRYSNVILTENGKILGGNRGINSFDNGVRPLIVGKPYTPPPDNGKQLPWDNTLSEYFDAYKEGSFAEYIAAGVQGVAISTAEQAIKDYGKEIENGGEFAKFLSYYLLHPKVAPCVYIQGGAVKDFSVFPYDTVKGETKSFDKLYLAERYYFDAKEKAAEYGRLKSKLTAGVNAALKKALRRLNAITQKQKDADGAEDNRINGDLILSNVYRIKRGDKTLTADNYYDGSTKEIALDERLSPAQNAQAYYKKYEKQKRTLISLKPQLESAKEEYDYLSCVMSEIELSESKEDLEGVYTELKEVGVIKEQSKQKRKNEKRRLREYDVSGYRVKVGRNNVENDEITLSAKSDYIWLHSKDYHSSHVIIEGEFGKVPQKVIICAAEICAYYSKARDGGKTEIVYVLKKKVKKPKGARPGFFVYEDFSSVMVCPDAHKEKLTQESRF